MFRRRDAEVRGFRATLLRLALGVQTHGDVARRKKRTKKATFELDWDPEILARMPSRPLRHLPPGGGLVEVTTRTLHGRFLMRPSKEADELIQGVLGRAQDTYPDVQLHGYWFLSNHYTILATFPDVETMAAFMSHVNSNLARELGVLYGWREKFWSRRYRAILVVDAESQEKRMAYLLAQGTKEGLVERPADWPGVSCLRALTHGARVRGRWVDRTALYNAGRAGKKVEERDFETWYDVPLMPLPVWATLSPEARQARVLEIVDAIERKAADENRRLSRTPMGARKILAQHPHARPRTIAKSPAPMCHAASRYRFFGYVDVYDAFVTMYRAASDAVLDGDLEAYGRFPPGCFRPSPPPVVRRERQVA